MLCYAVLCCAMLCCAMLCYAMLCYAMLCYAMLCYAILEYAVLCCAMLCFGPGVLCDADPHIMLFYIWRFVMDYFEIISKYFQGWCTRCRVLASVAVKNRRKVTQKICATPRNFEFTQNALSRSQILPRQQISGSIHAETSATCRFSSFSVLRRVWIWASGWCTAPPSHTHCTSTLNPIGLFEMSLRLRGNWTILKLFRNNTSGPTWGDAMVMQRQRRGERRRVLAAAALDCEEWSRTSSARNTHPGPARGSANRGKLAAKTVISA